MRKPVPGEIIHWKWGRQCEPVVAFAGEDGAVLGLRSFAEIDRNRKKGYATPYILRFVRSYQEQAILASDATFVPYEDRHWHRQKDCPDG